MISSYYLGYIYLSSILFIMQVLFSETKNSILLNVMDTKGSIENSVIVKYLCNQNNFRL